jgi:hypothetical protein
MNLENEAAGEQSNLVYQYRRSLRASVTYTIISADTSLTYMNSFPQIICLCVPKMPFSAGLCFHLVSGPTEAL